MIPTVQYTSKMTRWRAASLIIVHLLFVIHFLQWKIYGRTLAPVEPSEAFDTLHLGIVTVGFVFLAGVIILTALAGRFFCAWGCHILALQDLSAWLLAKCKIPTKPVRSRALLWIPPLAAAYLILWPQIKRILAGESLPNLRVVSEAGAWTSFTTTDLLRSFPGWGVTVFTLSICGFAMIYFLGSRSFCSYACPYGAIFAAAERLAPFRIIPGSGACSNCGLCISSCKSSVKVITEIRQFGSVVDTNCMKDLDCVSVCPTSALKYGLSQPSLFRSSRGRTKATKHYDFSLGEDLLIAGIVIMSLPVLRDLYDVIPFLLALALSALLAYFAVTFTRVMRQPRASLGNLTLKSGGRVTAAGKCFASAAIVLGAFMLHSAFVRYHFFAGELAATRTAVGENFDGVALTGDDGADNPRDTAPAAATNYAEALAHFQIADRWALVHTRKSKQQLAILYMQTGAYTAARNTLNSLLADDAHDRESRVLLARCWLLDDHVAVARQQLESLVKLPEIPGDRDEHQEQYRRVSAVAYCLLGDIQARENDHAGALQHFEAANTIDPHNWTAQMGRGAMLAAVGRWKDAASSFAAATETNPQSAEAHNNLAAALVKLDRREEALQHYQRALELVPNNPLAYCNMGTLLVELNRIADAQKAFEQALDQQPGYAPAAEGLSEIKRHQSATH